MRCESAPIYMFYMHTCSPVSPTIGNKERGSTKEKKKKIEAINMPTNAHDDLPDR